MKDMPEIERLLNKEKAQLDELQVPEELEERLRGALQNKNRSRKEKKGWMIKAAAACLIVLLVGYNFDTLAFYGKRLIGYDAIMNGTLQQLNELGKGQVIGESYTFKNGVEVVLDGIMLDENQLLAFYSIKDTKGTVKVDELSIRTSISGIFRNYMMERGHGELNSENKELKWVMSFEAPHFYEKTLNFKVGLSVNNILEEGKITFKLDRNKAMGYTIKENINQIVETTHSKIKFESITASPTRTTITGSLQNVLDLAYDHISGERMMPQSIEIKLVADGQEVTLQSGGMSTNLKGIKFHKEFDALPKEVKELNIYLESFSAEHEINYQIKLDKAINNKSVNVEDQIIEINKVYESEENTFITITTEEDIILSRVYLDLDGHKTELEETVDNDLIKEKDGSILHTRTLRFPKTGKNYELIIERITYKELYNEVIVIPIK